MPPPAFPGLFAKGRCERIAGPRGPAPGRWSQWGQINLGHTEELPHPNLWVGADWPDLIKVVLASVIHSYHSLERIPDMTAHLALARPTPHTLGDNRNHVLVIPGRISDPSSERSPSRGAGCYLWDADGRRYLDAVGARCNSTSGWGRKERAQAVAEQAERLAFTNTFVDVRTPGALAAKLAELVPGGSGTARSPRAPGRGRYGSAAAAYTRPRKGRAS